MEIKRKDHSSERWQVLTWHLVVIKGLFRRELSSALVARDGTVGLSTDSH